MSARIPLGQLSGRPFAVAEATALGFAPKRLRSPDLARPFWGVRSVPNEPVDADGLARAYATRMPRLGFFSHTTAAQLWGIPLPAAHQQALPLHVSVPADRRAPEGRGLIGHHLRIDPLDLTELRGLPVTTLERTLCDLAAILGDEAFVAAGDNILWRRRPAPARASHSSLGAAVSRHCSSRGKTRLTALVPELVDRSDSPPESTMRWRFIRARLPRPLVNVDVIDLDGNFIAMPDLQFAEFRMALDYEGDHHRTDAAQWHKDLRRVPLLEDARWHHTRMSAADLRDSRPLIDRLRRLLRERDWDG